MSKEEYTSDNIQSLSGRAHVLLRPRMYFEQCFSEESLDAIPFEVLCHAFDEYFDGNCKEIQLTVWKDSFSIKYDVGMPLRKIKYQEFTYPEMIMTKMMACSNLKKHLAVGQEFCSLGMATINFASEKSTLTSVWQHQKGTFEFEYGELTSREIVAYDTQESWTEIFIQPNKSIFKELQFTSNGIFERVTKIKKRLPDLNFNVEDNIK